MRVMVTGCGGMLGEAVYAEFTKDHVVYATDIDRNEKWLHHLDVRHLDDMAKFAAIVQPNLLIHLAAITDLERCELDPGLAYDTNFVGTHNAVTVAARVNCPLVYLSSAGVFGGGKITYVEIDIPNPVNVYAKSKYAGELSAMSYSKSIIVRAGWMMGGGPLKDKKFVNKIMKQIRNGAREILAVNDKLGTPTYTYELAGTLRRLVESGAGGIFHGACDGSASRVEVASEMVRLLGLQDRVKVVPVGSDYFKHEYFAKRPYSEKLESASLVGGAMAWQDCLKDYLERFEWGL